MTKSEYFRQHQALMNKYGSEDHPEIIALNNQRMAARHVTDMGLIDASNQANQGDQSSQFHGEWDADRRERKANRELLQKKADNLEAQGKAMAQYNHFFPGDE